MAQITADDGKPVSREEELAAMMALGISEQTARFLLAIRDGEIDGDLEDMSESIPKRKQVDNSGGQAQNTDEATIDASQS